MLTPRLKICGLTNLADARYCAGVGADYLGFIQHEASPRYVEPGFAAEMIEWLYGPAPVGVFVNTGADAVNDICAKAGFAVAQLHGDESPEECARVDRPVIKAVRIRAGQSLSDVTEAMAPYREHVDAFLLDTHSDGAFGGTGTSFDWSLAARIAETDRIFLAGGIGVSNVRQAVTEVSPWGVDLSSSLESEPGQKDFQAIDAFMEVYREVAVESTRADAPGGFA